MEVTILWKYWNFSTSAELHDIQLHNLQRNYVLSDKFCYFFPSLDNIIQIFGIFRLFFNEKTQSAILYFGRDGVWWNELKPRGVRRKQLRFLPRDQQETNWRIFHSFPFSYLIIYSVSAVVQNGSLPENCKQLSGL